MTIPSDHLRACPEHRLVSDRESPCPACETGVEARPDYFMEHEDHPVDVRHLQWQIKTDSMPVLLSLMNEYLEDKGWEGPWVSVAELDKERMPAGWTEQERWFNVVQYETSTMLKTIMNETSASETVRALRDAGYGR